MAGWAADAHALDEFLQEPNLARLGTVDENGDPHLVPVWFHWDGARFFVGSQAADHKVANVRRAGRAAIEVDSDVRRRRGVLARGTAWVVDGPDGRTEYARISQAQVRRYLPDRPPMETANRMSAKGEPVVIVLDPDRIVSWGR
jgi:PPOX class probable F420-dependent enzyme